jgi:hypothetical protein
MKHNSTRVDSLRSKERFERLLVIKLHIIVNLVAHDLNCLSDLLRLACEGLVPVQKTIGIEVTILMCQSSDIECQLKHLEQSTVSGCRMVVSECF